MLIKHVGIVIALMRPITHITHSYVRTTHADMADMADNKIEGRLALVTGASGG